MTQAEIMELLLIVGVYWLGASFALVVLFWTPKLARLVADLLRRSK